MPKKRETRKSSSATRKPAAKSASRKAPGKKTTGKKAPGRKAPGKKAPGKKAPGKKAAGSRAAGSRAGAAQRRDAVASPALADLERLIELMVDKEVVEVEFEESGARWRVRRAEPHAVAYSAPAPLPAVHAAPAGGAAAPAAAPGGGAADAGAGEPTGDVFTSPMVGTFYRAPSPDAEPFCKPGDKVAADGTLCIIEAMKVMNEIKAEREFEVLDVLVKNGESVEFGQPLFLVR